MATKKMQAGGAKKFTTSKRPVDLNLKERSQKNAPLKGGKMQKGGKTTSFTDDIATGLDNVFRKTYPFNVPHTKVTKALKYVDDTITKGHEGQQPDWYNKFKDKVKKTMHVPTNKKQDGGPTAMVEAMYKAKGEKMPTTKKTLNYVKKKGSGYIAPTKGEAPKGFVNGRTAKRSTMTYKTGGMVNPNADLQAGKSAGSKGVKSGVNPKAAASKVARGRVGGTSAAPKKAIPKAQYGMSTVSDNTRVSKSVTPNKKISKVSTSKNPGYSKDTIFDYKLPTGRRDNRVVKEGIKVKAQYGMSMSKMQMGGGTGDGTRTFKEVTITPPKKGVKVKRS
jgi:hypothetical protein